MATADRDVEMENYHYSSSPELSSLPSDSPSEPGSPSRLEQRRTSLSQRNNEIVVDATSASRFSASQPQQAVQLQSFSLDGVRLTKDGIPRKKPGRKPGTLVKKASDITAPSPASAAAGSGADTAKPRRVRKPRDPNAPPVQRKRRVQPSSAPASEAGAPRSLSSLSFPPKIELTSMRMDIDSRSPPAPAAVTIPTPALQPSRQPPLTMAGKPHKRDTIPSSMQNILNSDDSPPRVSPPSAPVSTTPARPRYDPVRSSNYDPVREKMVPHHPYGTGSLGSPHSPAQMPSRASASPSIASLVDPNPESHTRSSAATSMSHHHSPPPYNASAATSTANTQPPPYCDSISSLPPSPSPPPAAHNSVSSSSSQSQSTSAKSKAAALTASATTTAATTLAATTAASAPISKSSSSTSTKSAAAKSESNGHKSHGRPPPPPPISSSAKSTSKSTSAKTAAQKSSASKTSSAAAAAAESGMSAKSSGPVTASFRDVAMSGTSSTAATPSTSSAPVIKKFSSILQQERGGKQNKAAASTTSSPKPTGAKEDSTAQSLAPDSLSSPGSGNASANNEPERSILDFGKARPGEELQAPSIVLHIPLARGENNKYVNFMRMAEDHYGWDALHPRLAAHRDRKARIAAASAALERNGSGRESGDEMTDDMQSGDEGSNDENGGAGENSVIGTGIGGPEDAPAKPIRKKRMFKEDEYDKDDDFVDDSEMLWEEQAAASRDGFFVYSGPLVPEEEKPDEGSAPPTKRGRGGRGSRGGTGRTTAARSAGGRSNGGSGARSSTAARKPRASKQEKEQREREKADNDKATQLAASKATSNNSITGISLTLPSAMAVDA